MSKGMPRAPDPGGAILVRHIYVLAALSLHQKMTPGRVYDREARLVVAQARRTTRVLDRETEPFREPLGRDLCARRPSVGRERRFVAAYRYRGPRLAQRGHRRRD
jgi:hypothetical protein